MSWWFRFLAFLFKKKCSGFSSVKELLAKINEIVGDVNRGGWHQTSDTKEGPLTPSSGYRFLLHRYISCWRSVWISSGVYIYGHGEADRPKKCTLFRVIFRLHKTYIHVIRRLFPKKRKTKDTITDVELTPMCQGYSISLDQLRCCGVIRQKSIVTYSTYRAQQFAFLIGSFSRVDARGDSYWLLISDECELLWSDRRVRTYLRIYR